MRDLCLLRLIHAFVESSPMLLIQLYILLEQKKSWKEVTDLNIVSTALSLFCICWALASFNKNICQHNIQKIVLTWLGVIFQVILEISNLGGPWGVSVLHLKPSNDYILHFTSVIIKFTPFPFCAWSNFFLMGYFVPILLSLVFCTLQGLHSPVMRKPVKSYFLKS